MKEFFKKPENKINIVFWGLVFLLAFFPLGFGGNRPLPYSLSSLFVGILLLIWGLSIYQKRDLSKVSMRHLWFIVFPFLAVMLWTLIQALIPLKLLGNPVWLMASDITGSSLSPVITLDRYKTLTSFMKFLSYGVVFWLSLQLGRKEENARKIIYAIIFASIAYAIYGIAMHLSGVEKVLWHEKRMYAKNLTSVFINRNSYATYANIGIICTLAFMIKKIFEHVGHKKNKQYYLTIINNITDKGIYYIFALLLIFAALLMTGSRAGLVCGLIAIFGFFIISSFAGSSSKNRTLIFAIAFIIISSLGFLVMANSDAVYKRFSSIDEEISQRGKIYEQTIAATGDFPIYGSGLGTFEEVFTMYKGDSIGERMTARIDLAHNTYLETMLEVGIPAFILLFTSIISCLIICFRGLVTRKRDNIYPAITLAVSIAVWLHAFFDFSIQMPAIAVTYAAILGVGVAQSWSTRTSMSDRSEKCPN